jgi:hypothetical protein
MENPTNPADMTLPTMAVFGMVIKIPKDFKVDDRCQICNSGNGRHSDVCFDLHDRDPPWLIDDSAPKNHRLFRRADVTDPLPPEQIETYE